MATLTLTAAWVNLVSTGAAVSGRTLDGRTVTYAHDGEVRTYAGGRQRAITREGEHGTYVMTLRLLARADVDTLRSWVGQVVQIRDNQGRLLVGTYFTTGEVEHKGSPGFFDVPLTVLAVTPAGA